MEESKTDTVEHNEGELGTGTVASVGNVQSEEKEELPSSMETDAVADDVADEPQEQLVDSNPPQNESLMKEAIELEKQECKYSSGDSDNNAMLQSFCETVPATVQKLSIGSESTWLRSKNLETLAAKDFKLTELELDFPKVSCNTDTVAKLFAKQGATLEKLKLTRFQKSEVFSCKFPKLPNLKYLSLGRIDCSNPISFSDIFPNVTVLDLQNLSTHAWGQVLSWSSETASVIELTLPGEISTIEDILVEKTAKHFPNVRKLALSILPEVPRRLESIFEHFLKIEELSVNFQEGDYSGDSILTGLTKDVCSTILKSRNFEIPDKQQRRSSILNLTGLKKLELVGLGNVVLTDLSIQSVFLKMDRLEELKLHTQNRLIEGQVTPPSIEMLEAKVKLDGEFIIYHFLNEVDDLISEGIVDDSEVNLGVISPNSNQRNQNYFFADLL